MKKYLLFLFSFIFIAFFVIYLFFKSFQKEKIIYITVENNKTKKELQEFRNIEFEKGVDSLFIDRYFPYEDNDKTNKVKKSFVKSIILDKGKIFRADKVNPFNHFNKWYISKIQERTAFYREWYQRALEEKLIDVQDDSPYLTYLGDKNLDKIIELKKLAIAITMGNFYLDLNSSHYSDSKQTLFIDLKTDTTRFKKRISIPMDNITFHDLNKSNIKLSVEWEISIDKKELTNIDIFINGEYIKAEPIGARIYKVEL